MALALTCLASVTGPTALGQSANQRLEDPIEHCRAIGDEKLRLLCYEDTTSSRTGQPDQRALFGGWKLVRTKNPADGREVISIAHTADISRSDGLAGLMLKCGGDPLQILFVLVRPLPPRARPQVTLYAESTKVTLTGSVLPPGLLILLPAEASALANGPWLRTSELSVSVPDKESPIEGVIPLEGLHNSLQMLRANCLPR